MTRQRLPAQLIHEVKHYPPDRHDYLLSLFPLTIALTLSSTLVQSLRQRISSTIEFTGPGCKGVVQMRPFQGGECLSLEGVLLPARPGTYRFKIILYVGEQRFVVERGQRNIISSAGEGRWAKGPLLIEIEEGLYLANAAAAAAPAFLEGRVSTRQDRRQIAVLNASAERETRAALFSERRSTRFVYRKFPFTDLSCNPLDQEALWDAVTWIHEQMKQGATIVHCHAGMGRSASLIIAYLRLFRYPFKSYDWVVERVRDAVRKDDHNILPHVGLPEQLREIQESERHQKELARLLDIKPIRISGM